MSHWLWYYMGAVEPEGDAFIRPGEVLESLKHHARDRGACGADAVGFWHRGV